MHLGQLIHLGFKFNPFYFIGSTELLSTIMKQNLFCNFTKPLPHSPIRVISFFIRNQFLDNGLPKELYWENRFRFVKKLFKRLSPDIILLQGMNLDQCNDLNEYLLKRGYFCHFVASHSGKSFYRCLPNEYTGSFNGICFILSKFKLITCSGFWLKDDQTHPLLSYDDSNNRKPLNEGGTNKSFGCTHSYRYCIYSTLTHSQSDKKILVASTHFPCGGVDARLMSARLLKKQFEPFLSDYLLILGGSFLLFPDKDGQETYQVLSSFCKDYRDSKYHYGHNTSFVGYDTDPFKVDIYPDGFTESRNLDLIFQNGFKCKRSFSFSGEIDPETFSLIEPLNSPILNKSQRFFTSDRFLIGCDLIIDKVSSITDSSLMALNNDYFFNFTGTLDLPFLRVLNWNIKTSFHDNILSIYNLLLKWESRFNIVKSLLINVQSDIMLLQEMSPYQARQMKNFLYTISYDLVCRTCHSGHDLDEIQDNEWTGAVMGIAFSKHYFKLIRMGGFWLKKDAFIPPPQVPDSPKNRRPIEEGGTDKCFGDTHSYRSFFWVKLLDVRNNKTILVCVSDFPHQSKSGAQIECAKLINSFIAEFASDCVIFGGEVCTFNDEVGQKTLSVLSDSMTHWTKTKYGHFGHQTTFVGYPNDPYLVPISTRGIIEQRNIDILLHKGFREGLKSFSFLGEFDAQMNSPVKNPNERLFASDHLLIGLDLKY